MAITTEDAAKATTRRLNRTPFIEEIIKYFRDFLETDFHKRKVPKRQVRFHDDSNLLTGINLSKYPSLYKSVIKSVGEGFAEELVISKGKHVSMMPEELVELVKLQTDIIVNKKIISEVKASSVNIVNQASVVYKKEYDKAVEYLEQELSGLLKKSIVLPFITSIEKPLENLKLGDENNLYLMEEELTTSISSPLLSNFNQLVKSIIAGNKINVEKEIKDLFDLTVIRDIVITFFENFKVKDAYTEILELERNRNILDKQDFYFYFFDITFEKIKYPIFYLPFAIEQKDTDFKIVFDSQAYINKKALEYVSERYNADTGKRGKLKSISDRIFYLAKSDVSFASKMQEVVDELIAFFNLDSSLAVSATEKAVSKGLFCRISNNYYISLFDKSDEALINDYEDILEAIQLDPDGKIAQGFGQLIDDFIEKDPISIVREIENEWNDSSVPDKLVVKSPIPLNSEQIKIIKALNSKDGKYLIVEGPPGTGKSHTITAAIFNHILDNKSVLVLSDKKEALDVVEDKINDTICKVRIDDKFQNPILRLGRIGNKFNKILSTPVVNEIMKNHLVVGKKYSDIGTIINESINTLKNSLKHEIDTSEQIKIEQIVRFFTVLSKVSTLPKFISENESESSGTYLDDLVALREGCLRLLDKLSHSDFDIVFNFEVNKELTDSVEDMVSSSETLLGILADSDISDYHRYANMVSSEADRLTELLSCYSDILDYIKKEHSPQDSTFQSLIDLIDDLIWVKDTAAKVNSVYRNKAESFRLFSEELLEKTKIEALKNLCLDLGKLHKPIIGFLLSKRDIETLNLEFRKSFDKCRADSVHKYLKDFQNILEIADYIEELAGKQHIKLIPFVMKSLGNLDYQAYLDGLEPQYNTFSEKASLLEEQNNILPEELKKIINCKNVAAKIDRINIIFAKYSYAFVGTEYPSLLGKITGKPEIDDIQHSIEILRKIRNVLNDIKAVAGDIDLVKAFADTYPETAILLNIDAHNVTCKTLERSLIVTTNNYEFADIIESQKLQAEITRDFLDCADTDYNGMKKEIERLATAQMTYLMDGRLVDFWLNNKASAQTIKEIVRSKQKFPKDEFYKLKEAFPCILAGIRDYAEYVPLLPELFDLVIIDEASQVSIAQALPALIRAKKVLILGDRKQFGNVKSYQAKLEINNGYLNRISSVFEKIYPDDAAKQKRAEKFNIKTSVLDFFEFINNFSIQLQKYFRGYKEIISYSNKYFYNGTLQVMKIRGKDISEVLEFSVTNHDGKSELRPKTNSVETDFIIDNLRQLKESNIGVTVGIITPHTNQQKYLLERISALPDRDYYFDELKLKIMTFDTCQGEERDIIYYSMVANPAEDKLFGVFPKSLENDEIDEEDGSVRRQRLNVGFSRAKEKMHFILSKPLEQYSGAIGEALRSYWNVTTEARAEASPDSVDKNSPMEKYVLNLFYQTDFWKSNKGNIEFHPQFELGKYLKQLDPEYNHPNYKVDFLLLYNDGETDHKIIIEYDGFEEHFTNLEMVDKYNYSHYYNDEDIYRQKVLMSYGYKFLRINKFNLGDNPITTLDKRLYELVKKNYARASSMTSSTQSIS